MSEDDRKKYLEELMQPHIPLRVLQEIRTEISAYKDDKIIHEELNEMIDIILEIIDKHIEEVERRDERTQ